MNPMRQRHHAIYYIPTWALLLVALFLSACSGDDFMPRYFGGATEDDAAGAVSAPATPIKGGSCTIKLSATLCVALKKGDWSVGTEGQEKKCAIDLPPIPIRIQGGKASIHGDEFPDIVVPSGGGLPVPITINGKGKTDGKDNIGEGAVDAAGNMTLTNFSIFISALSASGKIPNVTLTTGAAEGSKDLPEIHGAPATGSTMTLVGSTVLGSVIPAADKYLLGATLQIIFKGTLSPKLSDCDGGSSSMPTTVQVTKITTDEQRRQHEQAIPSGTQMEVAGNILIPETINDVGTTFEASSKFRIRNISKQAIPLQIPPVLGAFRIKALTGDLTQSLPSQQAIVIQVTFKPDIKTKAGTVQESLELGSDFFTLIGVAKEQRGIPNVHVMDVTGKVSTDDTDTIRFPDVAVAAFSREAYFQCTSLQCNGVASPTQCQPCVDVAGGQCQLLPVDGNTLPLGEVDGNCTPLRPKAKESQGINFQAGTKTGAISQTIVIENNGTKDLTITTLSISEIAKSHSTGQFQVNPGTVYRGTDASVVGATPAVALPVTLAPHSGQKLFIVVTYAPTDLLGTDDGQGGNTVTDQGLLIVGTQSDGKSGSLNVKLRGTTTVQESPPLQVYFKTSTGCKMRGDDTDFPLKGITATTQNAAVPVFVKLADTASQALRVTNVELAGTDTDHFAWLDTPEKIAAVPEATFPEATVPEEKRCGVSVTPVPIRPNGIDIAPQAYTLPTMPLLGFVNFHRDPTSTDPKLKFEATLVVTTVALDARKQPIKRDDGSFAESRVRIKVLAVIHPRTGYQVFRLTQTMSILSIKESPTMASVSSADEVDTLIKTGRAVESDRFLFLGGIVLDPFDEMTIKNEDGSVASTPNDGTTAIFHAIDTHPSNFAGSTTLSPYTSLMHDGLAPEGSRGAFSDPEYKAPANFQTSGLRIYTATLSWPGPLESDPNKIPYQLSDCQQVDPCEHGELLGKGPTDTSKRGVCAFFYASAGGWKDSPSMHYAKDMSGGTRDNLCKDREQHQKLSAVKGESFVDGRLVFEDIGLRFWGPTFVHNIANSLERKPPALDDVFHISFSTDVMLPKEESQKYNYIPEERIDHAKQEYKVNLTDSSKGETVLCPNNTHNKTIGDKKYSSWKYFAPFLVQDKEGKIPAGCPEDGNSFTGGRAYMRGRPVDPVTGAFSVAAVTKFGNDEDLTFVFKDVSLYIILNGWLCDPNGSEAEGEGAKCYDQKFSDRDAISMISIMKEGGK